MALYCYACVCAFQLYFFHVPSVTSSGGLSTLAPSIPTNNTLQVAASHAALPKIPTQPPAPQAGVVTKQPDTGQPASMNRVQAGQGGKQPAGDGAVGTVAKAAGQPQSEQAHSATSDKAQIPPQGTAKKADKSDQATGQTAQKALVPSPETSQRTTQGTSVTDKLRSDRDSSKTRPQSTHRRTSRSKAPLKRSKA